jgi:hypothetical protein
MSGMLNAVLPSNKSRTFVALIGLTYMFGAKASCLKKYKKHAMFSGKMYKLLDSLRAHLSLGTCTTS